MTFANEGVWDRLGRLLVAWALGIAAWALWPGAWAMGFLIVATIALVTALAGYCPLYTLLGIST
ncbi:MAG: DUF2892 domain-containing protein, partial [Acidobacteria bacterium]|nr:DUF2892 domain-containing protein [Acidobacteriota bacterium]